MDDTAIHALTGDPGQPELTFVRTYRATVEDVRDACTDPSRLARWVGEIDGAPSAVGDRFSVRLGPDPSDVAGCEVVSCDPVGFVVTWTWQDEPASVVTVRIRALDDATTELTLRHSLAEPDHVSGYGGGWEQMLHGLSRALGRPTEGAPTDAEVEAAAVARWRAMSRRPLLVEQLVPASPQRVWAAFTTADGLRSWWWRHWSDVRIDVDARVGGGYRIEAPGVGIVVDGRYLTVEAPDRLAMTWRWTDADGISADESVDIWFVPRGAATMVTVRHRGPWVDDAPADSYRQGWKFTLGELAAVLAE